LVLKCPVMGFFWGDMRVTYGYFTSLSKAKGLRGEQFHIVIKMLGFESIVFLSLHHYQNKSLKLAEGVGRAFIAFVKQVGWAFLGPGDGWVATPAGRNWWWALAREARVVKNGGEMLP
jgi:hypothetical protein